MELHSLLVFCAALLVTAGSPGPSVAALVAHVISGGYRGVLPFVSAMWIGEALWLTFAVWGLASIALTFQTGFVVLKWVGVLYLLYLAWKMWGAPTSVEDKGEQTGIPQHKSNITLFIAGLSVTMGNPKIMVFYLALLPTIMDIANVTLSGWLVLVATMLLVLIVTDMTWVLCAAQLRKVLRSPTAVRMTNRISACVMAGAATAIVAKA